MARGTLTLNLTALTDNWRALDALSAPSVETGACVKADGYGLGVAPVGQALLAAGVRSFFVALAEEGAALRQAIGAGPRIFVFSGHMAGDAPLLAQANLIPCLNSLEQIARQAEALPNHPFAIQLDSGMNRLGLEADDWAGIRDHLPGMPELVMSHLACADEPDHPQNAAQLATFQAMTQGVTAPRSLAATGGTLLGADYHFDLVRPGIGLYGGEPFTAAKPVVRLSLPVIQTRILEAGESVGYGASWVSVDKSEIATVSAGYADGLIRYMSNVAILYAGDTACSLAGRVSMDLLTIDISHLNEAPETLDILCDHQTVDQLASAAGTIGYEILTSLGTRYDRVIV